jgi:hypothetical protein
MQCSSLSACFLNVLCIDMRDVSQDKIALRVTAKYSSAHRHLQEDTACIQLLGNHHQHTAAKGQNHQGESLCWAL